MKNRIEFKKRRLSYTPSLLLAFKFLGTLCLAAGVVLHVAGHVGHQTYLKLFGIDSGLFPKDIFWIGINGYYSLFDRFSAMTLALLEHFTSLIVLGLFIGCYSLLFIALNTNDRIKRLRQKPRNLPPWIASTIISLATPIFILIAIPLVFAGMCFGIGYPGLIGESYAKHEFSNDISAFIQGCEHPVKGYACSELVKDGKILAQGFILDSTPTHIAIFDVLVGRARAIERQGTELMGQRPDKLTLPR